MNLAEDGYLKPKHVGECIFCDNTDYMFFNCKCILLELYE
jgi:hypothetical protein